MQISYPPGMWQQHCCGSSVAVYAPYKQVPANILVGIPIRLFGEIRAPMTRRTNRDSDSETTTMTTTGHAPGAFESEASSVQEYPSGQSGRTRLRRNVVEWIRSVESESESLGEITRRLVAEHHGRKLSRKAEDARVQGIICYRSKTCCGPSISVHFESFLFNELLLYVCVCVCRKNSPASE